MHFVSWFYSRELHLCCSGALGTIRRFPHPPDIPLRVSLDATVPPFPLLYEDQRHARSSKL